ncbi:MAG: DUF748 domain-containing protein, partial [Sulfurimonadaceae bacterium]|nr:DUF748 domain-containing protein [Sulfurimonadaceae bacterium]
LDIALSTKEKNVHIKKSLFQDLHADIKRLEDESINLEKIVLPLSTTNTKNTKVEPQKPYHIKLDKFLFQNGSVGLTDEALRTKPYVTLDKINFTVDAIDSKEKTWLKYDFGMRINKSGTLKTAGSLRHTPLKQKGTLTLNRVSLQGINPYLDELSYLSLSDGYINLNAKTSYEKSLKAPDVKLSGSFKMEEFFLKDTRDKSDLFSMNSLTLDAFDFEMFPNRFYVETVRLDSFYLHAHIDEKKSLNLATLMKKSPEQEEQQQEKREAKEPFPLKIAKVQVKNGSAKFADLSLPIKFETLIHDLNGTIYSVSNTKGEASILDMKGEVDRYGVTTLKGSIDSSNPKSYTDLRFDFKNLELSSVSGYSASFAGHKIDEGKLFLGLKYHIVDSQMQGDNSVIIKKIKLGEAYKDENTTSLPLGFVIALLEDSEGIIDIDLPIVGDVDNPDFKYGALVWKTISNLIVKAVTSPFKFLSAAMGLDGENLDTIEFEAGLSEILPPEREKLDNIAKMLIKRPKIGLKIDATYDAERDTKALQFQKLLDLVVQKSDKKNIEDKKSAITVEILQDIYKETGDSKKLQQLQKELKQNYKGEAYRIEYLKMLVKESSLLQEITQEELFSLAEDRGKKITEFLISEKLIERDKVELSQVIEAKKDISNLIKTQLGIKSIEE